MPFCSRCLGASIGHIGSLFSYLFQMLLPIWFVPIGLSIMAVDWYMQNSLKKYHSNKSRLITGIMGGYSVGILIWYIFNMLIDFL